MPHPFGDLVTQYRNRKHGLSQGELAKISDLDPTIVSRMCSGERLTGKYSRERVLRVIFALAKAGAIQYQEEANTLLKAADRAMLKENELWIIAEKIQTELGNIKLSEEEMALIKHLHQRRIPSTQKPSPLEQLKDTLQPPSHPGRYIPVPEYARLFGLQAEIHRLATWLGAADGPQFLSIEGIGGIGKTVLAREIARTLTQQGQVTAEQPPLIPATWL